MISVFRCPVRRKITNYKLHRHSKKQKSWWRSLHFLFFQMQSKDFPRYPSKTQTKPSSSSADERSGKKKELRTRKEERTSHPRRNKTVGWRANPPPPLLCAFQRRQVGTAVYGKRCGLATSRERRREEEWVSSVKSESKSTAGSLFVPISALFFNSLPSRLFFSISQPTPSAKPTTSCGTTY